MAATIPTCEPRRLRAGDTWRWQKSLSDYPADTWTLYYVLLPEDGTANAKITITATSNGSAHDVNVAKATTANYTATNYAMIGYVDDGTNRETLDYLDSFRVEVLPDPATITSNDARTTAEKILAKLETAFESLSTGTIQSASENGKSYTTRNLTELTRDIGYWRHRVRVEKQKRRRRLGKPDTDFIRLQFRRPI